MTPSQLYQRAMSDFNKEASELEEKSAEAKARLQRTLDARRLRQQQAQREKEMRARMGRMDELLRKHKAKIDAIVALDVAADGRASDCPVAWASTDEMPRAESVCNTSG